MKKLFSFTALLHVGFIAKLVQIHVLAYCVPSSEPPDPDVIDWKSHFTHKDVNIGWMIKFRLGHVSRGNNSIQNSYKGLCW